MKTYINLRKNLKMKYDSVNNPKHYTLAKIEVIDFIEAWDLGFHAGNVVKYVARAKHKNNMLEDLKKARWYIDRLIRKIEKEAEKDESK